MFFLLAGVSLGAYYYQEVYDFFMGEGFENVVEEVMENVNEKIKYLNSL